MSDNVGQRIARLKWIDGLSWAQIEEQEGRKRALFRAAARRYKARHPEEFAQEPPEIDGVTAQDQEPDPEVAYAKMVGEFEQRRELEERKNSQTITFSRRVIALAWSADWHLGGSGVDYARLRGDLEMIRDTEGMYLAVGGDLLDNFVIGQLRAVRDNAVTSIPQEWAVVRMMLEIAAQKIIVIVEGNHDAWTRKLSGVDYFQDVSRQIVKHALFDQYEVNVTLNVGDWRGIVVRARHKWRGHSDYNDTHGPEKAAKFNERFHIGLAAHTHASGLCRQFRANDPSTNDPTTGLAMLAGSYKRFDDYAKEHGFPKANSSATVAVVIDSRHRSLIGFDNIQCAAAWLDDVA